MPLYLTFLFLGDDRYVAYESENSSCSSSSNTALFPQQALQCEVHYIQTTAMPSQTFRFLFGGASRIFVPFRIFFAIVLVHPQPHLTMFLWRGPQEGHKTRLPITIIRLTPWIFKWQTFFNSYQETFEWTRVVKLSCQQVHNALLLPHGSATVVSQLSLKSKRQT